MGWKWEDDDEPSDSRGFGDIVDNPNPRRAMGDGCSTRRIVKSRCRTEEVEPGRFVRKCENTEQILRDCIDRPAEVVESKTELTEDDVTDEVTNGFRSFESTTSTPFNFPGLRSDIESIERSLFGGLGEFLKAAEEMASGFFESVNSPSHRRRELPPSSRWFPANPQIGRDDSKQTQGDSAPYSELSGEVTDV